MREGKPPTSMQTHTSHWGRPEAASGRTCAKSESPTSVRPSHAVTSTSWQAATGMAISHAPAARASAVRRSAAARRAQ